MIVKKPKTKNRQPPTEKPASNEMNKFTNPLDPNNERIKISLENWVRKKLALTGIASVYIYEQVCSESSCMFAETLITVEQEETSTIFIIAKPLTFIRERDVAIMKEIIHKNEQRHVH